MADDQPHEELFLTVREMVIEIRRDVKDLQATAAQMQEARKKVDDHEKRIRSLEVWKYGIPLSGLIAIIAAAIHGA
jgi:hypothetical protein